MKKTNTILATFTLLLTCAVPSAYSQFIDNTAVNTITLAQILENPKDDQLVTLQGYLIKKVSSDKYIFKSEKDEIRVEIDHYVFPKQPFDRNVLIEITGEVEKDFLESPEIDVDRLIIVN
jgi:uncharacterized protein (TIGR00156 family)